MINIKQLKQDIKSLSVRQKDLKKQRKTSWTGWRDNTPYNAALQHYINRNEIYHMLIVYATGRNRLDRIQIKEGSVNKYKIEKLLQKYAA